MAINETSYVQIQAFMVKDLKLSGNELIIFACIHGFSQDGESWFTGSRSYLAEWCQTSKKTVSNNLAKLCEKGYLEKRQKVNNGVTFNDYRVAKKFLGVGKNVPQGGEECSTPPVEKTSPHILEVDNTRTKTKDKRFTPPTLEEVKAYCDSRNNGVDPQRFIDYYEAADWKDSKGNRVRNWKQKVISVWERGDGNQTYSSKPKEPKYVPTDQTEWQF